MFKYMSFLLYFGIFIKEIYLIELHQSTSKQNYNFKHVSTSGKQPYMQRGTKRVKEGGIGKDQQIHFK